MQNDQLRPAIAILTSPNQWFENHALKLSDQLGNVQVYTDHTDIDRAYDMLFILSYHRLIGSSILKRNRHNFVLHESDLPKGKGWAPLFWQILDGQKEIPFTIFEASDGVDSGDIYQQRVLKLTGYELNQEIRLKQAELTIAMCLNLVREFKLMPAPKRQNGDESFYKKRTPDDSRLDPMKTILEQFNLLRIVSNDEYPAFFDLDGHRYKLTIEEIET